LFLSCFGGFCNVGRHFFSLGLEFVEFSFGLVFSLLGLCVVFFLFLFWTYLFVGDGALLDFVFYWCGSSGFVFLGEWDVGASIFRFYILFIILVSFR
jgi:hypothetical protein